MNTVQSEAGAGKRHRLSIIFAIFFAVGLFSIIATYALTQ